MAHAQTSGTFSVPINLNGVLRFEHIPGLSVADAQSLVMRAFEMLLSTEHLISDSSEAKFQIQGELWQDQGAAHVGDLRIEVQHNHYESISGASVAIAPPIDDIEHANKRCRLTAYVSPDGAYITAKSPINESERVVCMVNITDGDLACHVMDPKTHEGLADAMEPAISIAYPNMCISLN